MQHHHISARGAHTASRGRCGGERVQPLVAGVAEVHAQRSLFLRRRPAENLRELLRVRAFYGGDESSFVEHRCTSLLCVAVVILTYGFEGKKFRWEATGRDGARPSSGRRSGRRLVALGGLLSAADDDGAA